MVCVLSSFVHSLTTDKCIYIMYMHFELCFCCRRRNQGAEYELNEVEPLEDKKGNSGNTIEMENIGKRALSRRSLDYCV